MCTAINRHGTNCRSIAYAEDPDGFCKIHSPVWASRDKERTKEYVDRMWAKIKAEREKFKEEKEHFYKIWSHNRIAEEIEKLVRSNDVRGI